MPTAPSPGSPGRWRGRPGAVLGVTMLATFATNLTLTILTIVQPAIANYFHTELQNVVWITVAPMLLSALLTPAFGRGADMYGRRRIWLAGFAVTIAGFVLSATAPSLAWLIVARAVTGIGTAAVMPASLALATAVYPPERRSVPIGWWTATVAFSPALGIIVGGAVADVLSWRALFWGQLPLALLALVLAFPVLPEQRQRVTGRFDTLGAVTAGIAVFAFILAVNRGNALGWASWPTLALFATAAVFAPLFLAVERRAANPVVPLRLFRDNVFTLALAGRFLVSFVYLGVFNLMPQLMNRVWGWTLFGASLALLPRPVAMGASSPFTAPLGRRFGQARVAVAGSVMITVAMLITIPMQATTPYPLLLLALVLKGFGLGIATASVTTIVAQRTPTAELATVSGVLANANAVASALGIAALLAVVTATGGVADAGAYRDAFVVATGLCAVAVALMLFLARAVHQGMAVSVAPVADVHLTREEPRGEIGETVA